MSYEYSRGSSYSRSEEEIEIVANACARFFDAVDGQARKICKKRGLPNGYISKIRLELLNKLNEEIEKRSAKEI